MVFPCSIIWSNISSKILNLHSFPVSSSSMTFATFYSPHLDNFSFALHLLQFSFHHGVGSQNISQSYFFYLSLYVGKTVPTKTPCTVAAEDKATSCDTSISFSCSILLLCMWVFLQFYSVRTQHEMDDILNIKKCLQKFAEFNPSWMYLCH